MHPTQIREVMTSPLFFCDADDSLQAVAQRMRDEDTGFMPLMRQGKLCGVLTDRDIVTRAIAAGFDPKQAKAYDFCSLAPETIAPEGSIEDAIRLMEARQIRRLLVVKGEEAVGVVSLGDLAECLPDEAEAVLIEISKSQKTLSHGSQG